MSSEISKALVKAQKEFAPALKTNTNPHFRSKYVGLDGCIEAVIDALNKHGIMLMQKNHPNDNGVSVETVFIHESGESISAGILTVPASKQDPQGYGSALTYARRYSLMAACGIAPEDDDGNAAKAPETRVPAPNFTKERLVAMELAKSSAIDAYNAGDFKGAHDCIYVDLKSNEEIKYVWFQMKDMPAVRRAIKEWRQANVPVTPLTKEKD